MFLSYLSHFPSGVFPSSLTLLTALYYSTTLSTDCYVHGPTEGCGTKAPRASSYGPSFNAIGGGWYAMERTDTYVRVWHWQRNDTNVPRDVKYGSLFIDTSRWVSSP